MNLLFFHEIRKNIDDSLWIIDEINNNFQK